MCSGLSQLFALLTFVLVFCCLSFSFSAIRAVQRSAPWHTYTHACFMYGRCTASAGLCVRVHHHLYFVCFSLSFGLYVYIKRVRRRPYLQVARAETAVDCLPPAPGTGGPCRALISDVCNFWYEGTHVRRWWPHTAFKERPNRAPGSFDCLAAVSRPRLSCCRTVCAFHGPIFLGGPVFSAKWALPFGSAAPRGMQHSLRSAGIN